MTIFLLAMLIWRIRDESGLPEQVWRDGTWDRYDNFVRISGVWVRVK